MSKEVEYLDYDSVDIKRVGCMKCNKTVANRQTFYSEDGKSQFDVLVHQSHSKRLNVLLEDKSVAALILCADCVLGIKDSDFPQLEKTLHWGWKRETEWKINEYYQEERVKAYGQLKKYFGIKPNEAKFPLRVWKTLLSGKSIVRRC